jgi:nitrogen regulatory protein PII
MKLVIAYIQTERIERILTALAHSHIHGLSLSEARGFGQEHDSDHPDYHEFFGVEMTKKTRIEIACHDDEADRVLEAIRSTAHTGHRGDGKIFILPILDAVRIKTGECGEAALGPRRKT